MTKSLLKNKDIIPTEVALEKALGEHFVKYKKILKQLLQRQLYPEMYWYGPSSGWAPRFCVGEITICGIYLAQNPLMGLIGIGDKIGYYLDKDIKLDPRARILYTIAIKKGPLKWVEIQLKNNNDIEVFLSLIDGKLRALLKVGIILKMPLYSVLKTYQNKSKDITNNIYALKKFFFQIGLSSFYSVKTILAAGKG